MKRVAAYLPPGIIFPFAGGTVPDGYLLCDGSAVSRSVYANLFAAIGTLHGSGNGTTTFHLPDYRGRFLRGSDNMGTGAAARDPNAATRTASNAGGATGATVGSVQDSANQGHAHGQTMGSNAGHNTTEVTTANTGGSYVSAAGNANGYFGTFAGYQVITTNQYSDGNGTPRNSSESRPQNANVNYIIKI